MKFAISLFALLGFFMEQMPTVNAEQVDVQIVLAVDVSSSVNYDEFDLQMRGYMSAFRDAEILQTIQSGALGKIAVAMTQWSGIGEQRLVLDWTVISTAEDAERVAERIEYIPRIFPYGGTAIANAIVHARKQFEKSPHVSPRFVIDVSGDGRSTVGAEPGRYRDMIVASGVTINALPILNEDPELDRYYLKNVVGGVGAFVEIAYNYADFSHAVKQKLAREIKGVWFGM